MFPSRNIVLAASNKVTIRTPMINCEKNGRCFYRCETRPGQVLQLVSSVILAASRLLAGYTSALIMKSLPLR